MTANSLFTPAHRRLSFLASQNRQQGQMVGGKIMPVEEKTRIIEQITLRKLEYARKYLESKSQLKAGNRIEIRDRLLKLADTSDSVIADLRGLLSELDAWGDQRLKVAKFDLRDLKAFRSKKLVHQRIEEAGMSALLDGEIAIEPPAELTPMVIKYVEEENPSLRLYAAKSRTVDIPEKTVPSITDERYPGVIFKPYRQEIQKALDFAEIDLANGEALFSTTLLKTGASYSAEFTELFEVFKPLISLEDAAKTVLYKAVKEIPKLSQDEVRTASNDKRTSIGGRIVHRSGSTKNDLRQDKEIMLSERATANIDSVSCNCFWASFGDLMEPVHAHIYAPEAEISIMGQAREASVKHVLQRILQVN
jgi:hypothetical protein